MLIYRLPLLISLLGISGLTFAVPSVLAHAGEKHGDIPQQPMLETEAEINTTDPSFQMPQSETKQTELTTDANSSPFSLLASGDWVASGFLLCPIGLFVLRRKSSV